MAATSVKTARALYFLGVEFKPEQHLSTRTLCVEKKDVFAQLPTWLREENNLPGRP